MAALFTALGDHKTRQFLNQLKENAIVISSSNGDVKKKVILGEVTCGITDIDDVFEAQKESDNIGIVFLGQNRIGSLLMPNTVNLIKKSPNVNKKTDGLPFK